jgi:hypothetical protein
VIVMDGPEPAELAALRSEAQQANDQALVLKGFALTTVAIVVGAAVNSSSSANASLALFLGLHVVMVVLFVQVGARRRQQANIAAYLLTFATPSGGGWESRLERRRSAERRIPVDRWYMWGEGLFLIFIAGVATLGSSLTAWTGDGVGGWMQALVVVMNVGGMAFAIHEAVRRPVIGNLIDVERAKWEAVRSAESAAAPESC